MKMIQENFDQGIKKLDEFLKKCSGDSVKLIAEMDVLENSFKIWVEHCQMTGMQICLRFLVQFMDK